MIRITVSYPTALGQRFDHDYYQKQHAALIRELLQPLGLQRLEIDRVVSDGGGKPAPFIAAAHMLFNDIATFKAAMAQHGKALAADLDNYTDTAPSVLISETY
ncbi:EthD family reductase (plasmid) [Acidovorax sp. DW039]|uniref:EthD family reductase n=1 Tax=Acidovorax sp. DW039 TaxID=3095606 RepID=UPI00308D4062|nr:EthD family reductase [Acidovorax sp. DW039]